MVNTALVLFPLLFTAAFVVVLHIASSHSGQRRLGRWVLGRQVEMDGWVSPRPDANDLTLLRGQSNQAALTGGSSGSSGPKRSARAGRTLSRRAQKRVARAWATWVVTWTAHHLDFPGSPLINFVRRPSQERGVLPRRSERVIVPALTTVHFDALDPDLALVAIQQGRSDEFLRMAALLGLDAEQARALPAGAGGERHLRALMKRHRPQAPQWPSRWSLDFWNAGGPDPLSGWRHQVQSPLLR